jgi:putative molybdopterin biosynthesis protein
MGVVTFAAWEQGLIVPRGNPKEIRSIADLARKNIRIRNREKGAGSRDLLDRELRRFGIERKRVNGYDSAAEGHLAAAYAVENGEVDCCVAVHSAARSFGLDFIPLAIERFDLVFDRRSAELPAAKALLDLLSRSQLRRKLQGLAGYDTSHTGDVVV